jgi:hypothetical protein
MNKSFNPKPDDVVLYSRVLAKNSTKVHLTDVENFLLKTFASNSATT